MPDSSVRLRSLDGIDIPEFMQWTGQWDVEAERVGEEFSAGKSMVEIAMARLYLIWKSGCWSEAKIPHVVSNASGKFMPDSERVFDDFEGVLDWFDSSFGISRSSAFDKLQSYERMCQLCVPIEISMAALSQIQSVTKELLERTFVFEPRTNKLLGVNEDFAKSMNLPGNDGSIESTREAIAALLTRKVESINSGADSRGSVSAELHHEIMGRPHVYMTALVNGDVSIQWSDAKGNGNTGVEVLETSKLPDEVRDIILSRLRARRRY